MSTPYVGEIRMVGFNFAPHGWALCDGSLLPIADNEALFYLIGTTFGGDGESTFGVPDLRGRSPVHTGQGSGLSPRTLGEMAGAETIALTTQHLPLHQHVISGSAAAGTGPSPAGTVTGRAQKNIYDKLPPFVTLSTRVMDPAGSNQAHDNMHPFLVISFIISLFGVFPPQS